MSVNLWPRSERSWRVEALGTPKFSKAMGANTKQPSKPAYFTSLRDAASSAAAPASRAAAEMYESANGQMTVTSQQSALPFCQGTRESPSGRFPSERDKPVGTLATGTPAAVKLRAIKSFREWCLSCRVRSCKQSYGGLEHQPVNHNGIRMASTSTSGLVFSAL